MGGRLDRGAAPAERRGFTLIELVITLMVAGLAVLATMVVFQAQNRTSSSQRVQVDAQQNGRVGLDVIVREVRQAGANIDKFHSQVALIDAAPYQLTFNGDIRTGVGGDPSMESSAQVPRADGNHYTPGAFLSENLEDLTHFNNGAETVRLTLDTSGDGTVTAVDTVETTQIGDDFQLVRQVNGGDLEPVAQCLRGPRLGSSGEHPVPIFQYWGPFNGAATNRLWGDTNNDGQLSQTELGTLTPVSQAELANVREVVVTLEALSDDLQRTAAERRAASTRLTTTVRPRNLGINASNLSACGVPPEPPSGLLAVDTPDDPGRSITLTFQASYDEMTGEQDVREYSIYRRRVGQSSFGAAIYRVLAAGQTIYTFVNDESHSKRAEDAPEDGVAYEYYVTAWDCEPQESNPSDVAGPVISQPNGPDPAVLTAVFDTPCDSGGDITVCFGASPDDQVSQSTFSGYRVYRGTSPGLTAYKVRVKDVAATHATSYVVHDVTNGLLPMSSDSTYYYVVRAVRTGIESIDSNEIGPVWVSDGLARATLQLVEDMPGDWGQRLELSWTASPSEACTPPGKVILYEVRRRSEIQGSPMTIAAVIASDAETYTYRDTMLTPGVLYEYTIRARDGGFHLVDSNVLSGRPMAENELLPPVAFGAADEPCEETGAIRVSWSASPSDATGEMTHYRIFRGTSAGNYDFEMPMVEAVGDAGYSLVDDEAHSGANAPQLGLTYYYAARSWNSYYSLQSARSNESMVVAESTPTAPDVTNTQDTPNDGGRSITVVFARSDHDGICDNTVTSYRIYRGTTPSVVSTYLGTLTAMRQASYTFVDDLVWSVDPPYDGVQYYYAVRAYAGALVSKLSNVDGPVTSVRDGSANEIIFEDNFEIERGWTHGATTGTDDWESGTPAGLNGGGLGNPDPTQAASGTLVWGTELGPSNGIYHTNSSSWLASPKIDCRSANHVKLVFKRWLNVERSSRDKADIEVRSKSSGWTRLWRNPNSNVTDSSWSNFELDISSEAAREDEVQVRFIITTNSSNQYSGWNIDDFRLEKF